MNVYELLSLKIIPQEISDSIYEQREANTFHTPYKDEIRLFSCIKQGNLELLIEQLKGFLGNGIVVGNMSKNNSRQHKYMAALHLQQDMQFRVELMKQTLIIFRMIL